MRPHDAALAHGTLRRMGSMEDSLREGEAVTRISELWNSCDQTRWDQALDHYWCFVRPSHLDLERELDQLDPARVQDLDAQGWFEFLLNKYFRWKYTAPNRYASTTKYLIRHAMTREDLDALLSARDRIFQARNRSIREALSEALVIQGLGTAGASGLLAVLFPRSFGTVDQFVVKALRTIPSASLPGDSAIARMNPNALSIRNGVLLIETMRAKAARLNEVFNTDRWTARKIDMVLWASDRNPVVGPCVHGLACCD